MKRLIISLLLLTMLACHNADNGPTPQIVGSWRVSAIKSLQSDWQVVTPNPVSDVRFGKKSDVANLPGGWCNIAENYQLEGDTLRLTYSEPQCIPFVAPRIGGNAYVITLTNDTLILKWQGAFKTYSAYTKYARIE